MVYKSARYLVNKDGVYCFTRHAPNDLQRHYDKPRIAMCLKTRNKISALKASQSRASKLGNLWLQMRISNMDVPAANLLIKGQPKETFTSCAPKLSDALEKYCRLKGKDRGEQFFKAAHRNIGYVIQKLGDRPLDTYSSSEAAALRDWLSSRNNSTPHIKRIFSTICAVMNLTIQENGLSCTNAFAKTFLLSDERPKRASISPEDIKRIQVLCLYVADDRRLLIALISNTGKRLSEALGLVWADIHLDHEYPH